jgi:hypothetical protein
MNALFVSRCVVCRSGFHRGPNHCFVVRQMVFMFLVREAAV